MEEPQFVWFLVSGAFSGQLSSERKNCSKLCHPPMQEHFNVSLAIFGSTSSLQGRDGSDSLSWQTFLSIAGQRIGTATGTREAVEKARARAKARVKPDNAATAESKGTSE